MWLTSFQALVLGVLQGLTEFLPVSSSGHLVIVQQLMGINPGLAFDVMVHLGTALAVIWVFRAELVAIFRGLAPERAGRDPAARRLATEGRRTLILLAVGTVPAGIAGLALESRIERLFGSVRAVGFMLLLTAALLYWADRVSLRKRAKSKGLHRIPVWKALVIGGGQAAAIAPGLSRSGATISAGLALGINRDEAARFSFLLSLPAILGAALVQIGDLIPVGASARASALALGTAAAAVSGYLAILVLLDLVRRGRLWVFSAYTGILGMAVLAASYSGWGAAGIPTGARDQIGFRPAEGILGLVLRDERVVYAETGGEFHPLVNEGERVPAGAAVCALEDDSSPVLQDRHRKGAGSGPGPGRISKKLVAPESGVVSYWITGYEGLFSPVAAAGGPTAARAGGDTGAGPAPNSAELRRLLALRPRRVSEGARVVPGEPLFKLITGYQTRIFVPWEELVRAPYRRAVDESGGRGDFCDIGYKVGQELNMRDASSGDEIVAVIESIREGAGALLLLKPPLRLDPGALVVELEPAPRDPAPGGGVPGGTDSG